jgi:hypothetical protein
LFPITEIREGVYFQNIQIAKRFNVPSKALTLKKTPELTKPGTVKRFERSILPCSHEVQKLRIRAIVLCR